MMDDEDRLKFYKMLNEYDKNDENNWNGVTSDVVLNMVKEIIESEKKKAVLEVLERIETELNDFPYSPITMLR